MSFGEGIDLDLAEVSFDSSKPIDKDSIQTLSISKINERIAAINKEMDGADDTSQKTLSDEKNHLEYWQAQMTLDNLNDQLKLVEEKERAPSITQLTVEENGARRAELTRRENLLKAQIKTAQDLVDKKKAEITTPWNFAYKSELFGFDPTLAINEGGALSLTQDKIEARLKELDKITAKSDAASVAGILLPEEKNEKLQLELWKLKIDEKNLSTDATPEAKKELQNKIDAANKALEDAKQIAWDFAKYAPKKTATASAGDKAPSGEVANDPKNEYKVSEDSAFDHNAKTVLGQMFEATGKLLSNPAYQILLEGLFVRPLGAVSAVAAGALYTAGGATLKVFAVSMQAVSFGYVKMDWTHSAADHLIGQAEEYTGTYALIYKPLLSYPLSLYGWAKNDQHYKDLGKNYRNFNVLWAHAKNHDVVNLLAPVTLSVIPKLAYILGNSSLSIPSWTMYAGYNLRRYMATDPKERDRLQGLADGWKNTWLTNLEDASNHVLSLRLNDLLSTTPSPPGTKKAKSYWYKVFDDALSPLDPSKSPLAVKNNIARWVESVHARTAGANNKPTNASLRSYFAKKMASLDEINSSLEKIKLGATDPKLQEQVDGIISKIGDMKNDPPIEQFRDFQKSIEKIIPGESAEARIARINDLANNLLSPKNDYFTLKVDKAAEMKTAIDSVFPKKDEESAAINKQISKEIRNMKGNPSVASMEKFVNTLNDLVNETDKNKKLEAVSNALDELKASARENLSTRPSIIDRLTTFTVLVALSPIILPLWIVGGIVKKIFSDVKFIANAVKSMVSGKKGSDNSSKVTVSIHEDTENAPAQSVEISKSDRNANTSESNVNHNGNNKISNASLLDRFKAVMMAFFHTSKEVPNENHQDPLLRTTSFNRVKSNVRINIEPQPQPQPQPSATPEQSQTLTAAPASTATPAAPAIPAAPASTPPTDPQGPRQ